MRQLAVLLLPTFMRNNTVVAIAKSIASCIDTLKYKLLAYRNKVNYDISITPQVCYLEKALNDRYDTILRRIRVDESVFRDITYIKLDSEQRNQYLGSFFIYNTIESGYQSFDFYIVLPAGVLLPLNEIRVFVSKLKLASKTFDIIYS
jgi:hypothetical protein